MKSLFRQLAATVCGPLLVVVLAGGCSSPAEGEQSQQRKPTSTSATTTSAAPDPEVMVECSNVARAYNAWQWVPTTSADWALVQVKMRIEDGKAFHDAVKGYTDQPALELVVAIAAYNYELALVQVDMTINGGADTTAAEGAIVGVIDAYLEFHQQTCE
jgi:hypothetical protein